MLRRADDEEPQRIAVGAVPANGRLTGVPSLVVTEIVTALGATLVGNTGAKTRPTTSTVWTDGFATPQPSRRNTVMYAPCRLGLKATAGSRAW